MTQLFILPVQSVTGAVITIIGLLLVAAIIGYFSAWFYARSIYTPIIKGLENDKEELKKELAVLKDDIAKLKGQIDKLNAKIAGLEKEIDAKEKEIKDLTRTKK